MIKPDITPTPHETTTAERFNFFLMVVSAAALIVMSIGLAVSDSWVELIDWTGIAICVVVIVLLAFAAGLHGGRTRG